MHGKIIKKSTLLIVINYIIDKIIIKVKY